MGETETVHAEVELEAEGGLSFVSHAGFIPRLIAYLLDMALVAIPFIGYIRAASTLDRLLGLFVPVFFPGTSIWVLWAVFAGATYVYFTALEAYAGRTVGKRITGIKVTDLHGDPPDPVACLLRNLYRALYHIPLAGQAVAVLDGFLVLRTGRRLGDMAAETLVVKEPYEWGK